MSDERQGQVGVSLPVEEIRAQMREDRRFRAARAAMEGLLAGGAMAAAHENDVPPRDVPGNVAEVSVWFADALLAALETPKATVQVGAYTGPTDDDGRYVSGPGSYKATPKVEG